MHTHLFTKCIIDNIYINYILRNNTKKKKKKKKKKNKRNHDWILKNIHNYKGMNKYI